MGVDIRDAFFDEIYDIASKDKDVIFITADADAFSLRKYKKDFPNQFINVGVAEQNMVLIATGLALTGKKVFIYSIIPFITMRCYEHIKANICSMDLDVTIVGCGAGLSFSNDGPTHHAIHDIGVMRVLPEMTILNPCDTESAKFSARYSYENKSPKYVRIDKGVFDDIYSTDEEIDGLKVISEVKDVNIISTGFMTHKCLEVKELLDVDVGVLDLLKIKPLNEKKLLEIMQKVSYIITVEENSITGGIGSIISEFITDNNLNIKLKRISLDDKQYFEYGTREWLHSKYGIDTENIINVVSTIIGNK